MPLDINGYNAKFKAFTDFAARFAAEHAGFDIIHV